MLLASGGEAFDHYATGVGAVLTGIALVVGGVWAYVRFLSTPESRLKITVELTAEWLELAGAPFVRAEITVCNVGGVDCYLLPNYRGPDAESQPAGWEPSRVGFYALGTSDRIPLQPSGQGITWPELRHPMTSVPIVDQDVSFRPSDVYKRSVLLRPPDDAVAALVAALIFVLPTPKRFGVTYTAKESVSYDCSVVVTCASEGGKP